MISAFKRLLTKRAAMQFCRGFVAENAHPPGETIKLKDLPLYENKFDHFKISKVKMVEKIAELFDLKRREALELVMKNEKYFINVPVYSIAENYSECINCGLTSEILLKYPRILTTSNNRYKLDLVRKLPYSLEVTAPLLILEFRPLKKFVAKELVEYNISAVAGLLEVP